MKKRWITALLAGALSVSALPAAAEDSQEPDYTNEAKWYERCSAVLTSEEDVRACEGFQSYTKGKRDVLNKEIAEYDQKLATLDERSKNIEALLGQQRTLISEINAQIAQKEAAIQDLAMSIEAVQQEIDVKQEEMDVWNDKVKERMKKEQLSGASNPAVDLIMGSDNLADTIRKLSGLQRLTQSDQAQASEIAKLKKVLDERKEELERLSENAEAEKASLVTDRKDAEKISASYTRLENEYKKQMASLTAQKRSSEEDLEKAKEFTIQSNVIPNVKPAKGWTMPVQGPESAGTWAYPGGGTHLGLDIAVNIGTQVVAPANGVILYANAPYESDSGYLGSWDGFPAGGGNSVAMLCNVNGTLYSVSFFHLSKEGLQVKAGDTVTAGQPLALTGHTGNSTGPHCHIEIINLGNMSAEEAIQTFAANPDFSWGNGWDTTATACEAGKATPCRERPEKYLMVEEEK